MALILVAEDEKEIALYTEKALRMASYDVVVCENGLVAFEKAKELIPDLIVSDVMMPELDGWGLMRKLRTTHETAFIPVIFLTQLTASEDRLQAFRLGADDYLAKPYLLEELQHRVTRILHNADARQRAREEVAKSSGIQGSLGDFGLPSLLTLLDQEGKTGLLTLREKDKICEITVRDGSPVAAKLTDDRGLAPVERIYVALEWREGSFEFETVEVRVVDTVEAASMEILMEAARRMDEAAAQKGGSR